MEMLLIEPRFLGIFFVNLSIHLCFFNLIFLRIGLPGFTDFFINVGHGLDEIMIEPDFIGKFHFGF